MTRSEMSIEEFESRARAAFDAVPPEFRERVLGPVVVEGRRAHRDVGGMLTLGECVHAPGFGEGGEAVSTVYLYYGSFAEAARRDRSFRWEEEIVETVQHEIQHHVEDRAGHPGLRDLDWAEEENQKRRQGRRWTPHFWRAGEPVRVGERTAFGVSTDVFVEVSLSRRAWDAAARSGLELTVGDADVTIEPGELSADEEWFEFPGQGRSLLGSDRGDLVVVVVRERTWIERLRG